MKYGVIGESLGHSYSPRIHAYFGNKEYELKELGADELKDFISAKEFKGVNVTIPYKTEVMKYCIVEESAYHIGSVNTVVNREGVLYGYNTDSLGFAYMAVKAGVSFNGKKVLVLGSGGTSRTATCVATEQGAAQVIRISRNGENNYQNISQHYDAEVIINTTPVGMFPDIDGCPLSLKGFRKLTGVLDVIYNPARTRLLSEAKKMGIPCSDGLPMLIAQAYYADRMFRDRGESEDAETVIDAALKHFRVRLNNIILTGMPGCGKTTVGRRLAELLGIEFADTDELVEQKSGKSPATWIAESGEEAFRDIESTIIEEVCRKTGQVIACGGGSILREENRRILERNGHIIYLEKGIEQLETEGRPLSQDPERLRQLFEVRKPIYEKFADISMHVSETCEMTVDHLVDKLKLGNEKKSGKRKILVINGPNINMLGIREKDIYGTGTYKQLIDYVNECAAELNMVTECFQSNHEGAIVDKIQEAYEHAEGIVINPAAYTHTSVAIADALKAVMIPAVEVHLTDVTHREEFRKISYVKPVCIETIAGFGFEGYKRALQKLDTVLFDSTQKKDGHANT